MFVAHQRLRSVIAALCGFAYLVTLQQGPLLMLTVLLHGANEMHVVQEAGQTNLVFHHHHEDGDADTLPAKGVHLEDHHHHADHVIKVAFTDNALAASSSTLRMLSVPFTTSCVVTPVMAMPRCQLTTPQRARPPPLIGGGVLARLRTTMLVI